MYRKLFYRPAIAAGILFLGFVDTHTDEPPVILGLTLICGGTLGLLFPRRFVVTALALGMAVFASETLVHFGLLHAPWEGESRGGSSGVPWGVLLIACIPAFVGAGAGAGIGRATGILDVGPRD